MSSWDPLISAANQAAANSAKEGAKKLLEGEGLSRADFQGCTLSDIEALDSFSKASLPVKALLRKMVEAANASSPKGALAMKAPEVLEKLRTSRAPFMAIECVVDKLKKSELTNIHLTVLEKVSLPNWDKWVEAHVQTMIAQIPAAKRSGALFSEFVNQAKSTLSRAKVVDTGLFEVVHTDYSFDVNGQSVQLCWTLVYQKQPDMNCLMVAGAAAGEHWVMSGETLNETWWKKNKPVLDNYLRHKAMQQIANQLDVKYIADTVSSSAIVQQYDSSCRSATEAWLRERGWS